MRFRVELRSNKSIEIKSIEADRASWNHRYLYLLKMGKGETKLGELVFVAPRERVVSVEAEVED